MRGGEKISVLKYNPITAAIAGGFEKDNLQNVSQIRVFTQVSAVMKPYFIAMHMNVMRKLLF